MHEDDLLELTIVHQEVTHILINQDLRASLRPNQDVLVILHEPTLASQEDQDDQQDSLALNKAVWHANARKAIQWITSSSNQQRPVSAQSSGSLNVLVDVLYASPANGLLLLSIPHDSPLSDQLPSALPHNTRLHRIDPRIPLHPPSSKPSTLQHAVSLSSKPDPQLVSLLANISIADLQRTVRYLTGEDPKSPLTTRHSLSKGHRMAAEWVKAKMLKSGCDSVDLVDFKEGYGPNVVCTINGTDPLVANEQVILGAHLDDRGSLFIPFSRAPGADDDASGTSMLLAFLRTLHTSGLRLRRTLKVVNFAGEEQGLIGSRAYARAARDRGDKIVFMLQGDMLAYRKPGEPLQCALPAAHASPQANLVVRKVAEVYVPEVTVGTTTACCSDHQSFFEQGFVSTQVFERNGPIADPMYHNRGDLSDRVGYDWEQLQAVARVAVGTVVSVAEIHEADK
ncbi:hypothetical protein BCR44DRAFT_116154 [Catenaria anguillulae PL171]|uniref:Peptide hydrolase n=1 Tax=Catenaria anguillulae PL171 TaxID=765915 RepID=A0A1Y2HHE5_9FUNG|nr:hypothetical protein BCR44DRAFT_116154 [Catenaria anguillulae PL171]